MENYISILEQIARRDLIFGIFGFVLCIAVVFGVWGSFFYRITKKTGKKRMTNKKKRERKRDILKSILVNFVATILMALFAIGFVSLSQWDQNNYKTDIEQKTFVTYQGDYSIETNRVGRRYHQYVVLPNGHNIRLDFIKHFWLKDGEYTGTVAYGKNSNIVVYIDKTTD